MMHSRHRPLDYVSTPDMAAFTVGRIVMAKIASGCQITDATVHHCLMQIARGSAPDIPAGVTADMALGAIQHIETLKNKEYVQTRNRPSF